MDPQFFSTSPGVIGVSRREALRRLGLVGLGVALAGRSAFAAGGGAAAPEPTPTEVPHPPLRGATGTGVGANAGVAGVSLEGAQPGFYRLKIGAFEAIAFNDGGVSPPVTRSPFGVGEPVEKVVSVLRDAYLPIDHVNMYFNVLLVRMGSELVLIDTGYGSLAGKAAGRLPAQLAAAGVKPEQVTALFLSHAHGDHFGGMLDTNGQIVFKNAIHYVGKKEFDFWTASSPDVSQLRQPEEGRKGMIEGARGILEALRGKFQFIAPGDKLIEGLEIIDAPGHTPGHLAFLISSGGDQLLHFVDAAHHHAITFEKPEWVLAYDVQPQLAEATRRKLFDRAAADRLRVFGAHMPFPALGHVKALEGKRYDFVIEPWMVG